MATLAIEQITERRLFIRLSSATADQNSDLTIALEAAVQRTGASVAIVYRFDSRTGELNAVARHAKHPAAIPDVGATLSSSTSRWLEALTAPEQGIPSRDPNFEKLPEVIQHRLNGLLVVPLRASAGLLGILTLGRYEAGYFDDEAVVVAERSASLLTAAIERDTLQQKLEERKLVERAKGILQQRQGWSEERAYLTLRNNSRRRQKPMVELAREIIDNQTLRRPVRQHAGA